MLKHHKFPQTVAMHQYVHDTYIGPVGAVFNVQHWNVLGTANRTTNMCEGFHLALNRAVAVRHPSVFRLTEVLKHIDAANERNLAQLALSAHPKRKKAKYVAVERLTDATFGARIPSLAQVMNYVDAIAYQLWDVKH